MKSTRNQYRLMLLLIIGLSICSCRTMNLAELTPSQQNIDLLPPLNAKMDLSLIENIDLASVISTTEFKTENESDASPSVIQTYTEPVFKSETTNDLKVLFDRDVKYNMTKIGGEKCGTIVCRVAAINTDDNSFALSFLSIGTFGLLNLVGFPFASIATSIDIDVELFDINNELVAAYHSIGKSRVYSAMYYGFEVDSAVRLSKIRAFKKAMNKVKAQIDQDFNTINAALSDQK